MPHSFFTRLLGVVIAVVSCAPLLVELDSTNFLFMGMLGVLPLLCALFMWRVMREAPVFDDQAFHRTLPPRDGSIFLRQLRMPLGVLAIVALAVVGRCLFYNYGWRTMAMGTVQVAGPAFFLMMAFAVAAVAESGRQGRRIWGWLALVVPVVLSVLAVAKLRENEQGRKFLAEFSLLLYGRLLLPAGLAYLPLWWLIAARRRSTAGLVLAAALGLALPWFYADEIQRMNDRMGWRGSSVYLAKMTHLKYPDVATAPHPVRKAWPQGQGAEDDVPLSAVLEVAGLQDNELLFVTPISIGEPFGWFSDHDRRIDGLRLRPVQSITRKNYGSRSVGVMGAKSAAGGTVWGRQSEMEVLRRLLPAGTTLGNWDNRDDWSAPITVGVHVVDLMAEDRPEKEFSKPAEVASRTWMARGNVIHFGQPEILEAAASCRLRRPQGGGLEVKPLLREGRYPGVEVDLHRTFGYVDGDPWFHLFPEKESGFPAPRVVVVDEAGKVAWLVDDLTPDPDLKLRDSSFPFSLVGMKSVFVIGAERLDEPASPDMQQRRALLPRCKIYIYWSESTPLPEWTLPPVK